MNHLVLILAISLCVNACEAGKVNSVFTANKFDILKLPEDTTVLYFKQKTSSNDDTQNRIDSFKNQWYSKMLFAMKEPILSNYEGEKEIYRFTWLRTFHHPISVRLEKQNTSINLFVKVCNGAGGYEPGNLIFDTAFAVTEFEYKHLFHRLDSINFWVLKTDQPDYTSKDGSEWILEGIIGKNYYIVTRWSPTIERQGNFRIVGEYLLSISKIKDQEFKFVY